MQEFKNIGFTNDQIHSTVIVEAANIADLLFKSGKKGFCVVINDDQLMPPHKILAPSEEIFTGISSLLRKMEMTRFRIRKTRHYGLRYYRGKITVRFPSEVFEEI